MANTPQPKFQPGQSVALRGSRAGTWLPRRGKIIRVLPHSRGAFQYRIKSDEEAFERIVEENRMDLPEDARDMAGL